MDMGYEMVIARLSKQKHKNTIIIYIKKIIHTCALLAMIVPTVEIDGDGKFKYVLLKMSVQGMSSPQTVVRGYLRKAYHVDVMEEAVRRIPGATAECLGGGRIRHDTTAKTIFVYGYSQAFGLADHAKTCELLRASFPPPYTITWSNDGY